MGSIPCSLPFSLSAVGSLLLSTPEAALLGYHDLPAGSLSTALVDLRRTCWEAQEHLSQVVSILGRGETLIQGLVRALASTPPALPSLPLKLPVPVQTWPGEVGTQALLEAHCLGRFHICTPQGTSFGPWRNGKARSLIKYLLTHRGKAIPRDILIETFWAQYPVEAANNSLRVALHDLRRALGSLPEGREAHRYIVVKGGNYSLLPEAPIWVDAEAFLDHWQKGRSLEKLDKPMEAATEYRQALGLYKGDFLEEDLYEDWAIVKREELLDIYLAMLEKLSAYCLQESDYEGCTELLHNLLAKDRCREDAYQRLMVCHSRLGYRSRALHWYRLCVRTLRRELDSAVSPETEALCQRLLRGETL